MTARRLNPVLFISIATASLLVLLVPRAHAAWGDLDTHFAAPAGISQVLAPGDGYENLEDVAIQPDGKIVVAGSAGVDFFGRTGVVQRFMPDGTLDPSFGTAGTLHLTTPSGVAGTVIHSIALQSDGKIVCAATKDNINESIFRVTADGKVDTTFAAPGNAVHFSSETPNDVIVSSNADIYVGIDGNSGNPRVRRISSSGTHIGTFASTVATTLSGTSFWQAPVFIRQSGSGIIMATTGVSSGVPNLFAAKLDSTGNFDTSWGTGGKTTVAFPDYVELSNFVIQPSGAIVLAGNSAKMGDDYWVFARLTSGGQLDTSFAGGGKFTYDITPGFGDYVSDVTSDVNGNLVVAGSYTASASVDGGAIGVFSSDGAPLESFGPRGLRLFPLAKSLGLHAVAVQPDNKVVTTGSQLTPPSGADTLPYTMRLRNATPTAVSSKVSSPKNSKSTARKLTKFGGTATSDYGTVATVEIALQRVDSKLLKKKKQCLWLSSNKAKFKKVKAVKKKCSAPRWLKATGTGNWSYKLKKKLPKGSYVLSVRATASDGTVQPKSATKKFKVT